MTNFIIYALPRSRTAWCSKFLTYKDHSCEHEASLKFRSVSDFKTHFNNPNAGTSETGVAAGHWLFKYYYPDIKEVVIYRPISEIVDSLLELDLSGVATYEKVSLTKHLSYQQRLLDSISSNPKTLTVNFSDLKKMESVKELFEFCLPYQFDVRWWGQTKNQNIQVNPKDMFRYYYNNKSEIEQFKRECKRELRHLRKTDPDNSVWKEYH